MTVSGVQEGAIATRLSPGVEEDARHAQEVARALERAAAIADRCAANAAAIDREGAFPIDEFALIAEAGLLAAPLSRQAGGLGLGSESRAGTTLAALSLLKEFGRGNLVVGRLYEGHVNALQLIQLFGTPQQVARYAADARDAHKIFGVWNTEAGDGVKLLPLGDGRYRLAGAKTFASGAGQIARPLITGTLPDGGWQMCVVPIDRVPVAIDPSWWRPLGMRASASYRVDLGGVELEPDALIGAPGDYYRQPWFSGGAIRFAAVQLGGAEALFDATRDYLRGLGRIDDPHQRARAGEMAIAIESGTLWLRGAAEMFDRASSRSSSTIVAYANMMRTAIEGICLDVMRLAERSVGARGLLQPHPFERIGRDLTLYLRQPAPDAALTDVGCYALERGVPTGKLWNR